MTAAVGRPRLWAARLAAALACTTTPNLVGCTAPRLLVPERFESQAMRGVWMGASVLLPPRHSPAEHLPLVVFLHGGGDDSESLERHGVAEQLVQAMGRGELPRFVLVAPQGDLGFWADWYDGSRRYETYVTDELLPSVARQYGTLPCPEGCHLIGVSMGGEGTLRFAAHQPHLWRSVSAVSGPCLDTDSRIAFLRDPLINTIVPTWHVFGPPTPRARIEADDPFVVWRGRADVPFDLTIAWGTEDREFVREGSRRLVEHLTRTGIPHESIEFAGTHSWASWSSVIPRVLMRHLGERSPTQPPSNGAAESVGSRSGGTDRTHSPR